MILVIALLGILFVVGVAFLKTVDYGTRNIEKEQQKRTTQSVVEMVSQRVGEVLRDRFVDEAGIPYRSSREQQDKWLVRPVDPDGNGPNRPVYFEVTTPTYGQMLGIDGTLSQPEPDCFETQNGPVEECGDTSFFGYRFPSAFGNVFYRDFRNGPLGDVQANLFNPDNLAGPSHNDYHRRIYTGGDDNLNQQIEANYNASAQDADGDGIRDSVQFNMEWLGLADGQLLTLRQLINPAFNPRGDLWLSLRVVDHGSMVNLNSAHKVMVQTILSDDPYRLSLNPLPVDPPYDPQIEEALLRHRHLLAPRAISPSRLHGNPYEEVNGEECGGGDLGCLLLAPVDPGDATPPWWHWWPMAHDERFDPNNEEAGTYWYRRMMRGGIDDFFDEYDRRHVLTTTSYDDLFSRGGWTDWYTDKNNSGKWESGEENVDPNPNLKRRDLGEDWIESMISRIEDPQDPDYLPTDAKGFQYPFYPSFTIAKNAQGVDRYFVQELDGRFQLSLPFIEESEALLDGKSIDTIRTNRNQPGVERAIGLIQAAFTMLVLNARGEEWEVDGVYDYNYVGHTAAALTANLIDFADSDGIPTYVHVRGADPSTNTFGRIRREPDGKPSETAYGIERQPYITEIAAVVEDGNGEPDPNHSAWAVELFYPYNQPMAVSDFGLYLAQPGSTGFPPNLEGLSGFYPFTSEPGSFGAFGFAVVYTEAGNSIGKLRDQIDGRAMKIDLQAGTFEFQNQGMIYLVRRGGDGRWHPIDQFAIDGDNIAVPDPLGPAGFSMERMLRFGNPLEWTFTVPAAKEYGIDNDMSLGNQNDARSIDVKIRPVEVVLADEGRLTADYTANPPKPAAFPTTGSLLLLMRHANVLSAKEEDSRAFTVPLAEDRPHITSGTEPYELIDNGCVPVFDNQPTKLAGKLHKFRNHVAPSAVGVNADGSLKDEQKPNNVSLTRVPGGTQYLPWGQLVFDYFTALPLGSDGPDIEADGVQLPRIDLDGKRVHGRINLQTAPWSVIAGLPLMPKNALPVGYRARVGDVAALDDAKMKPIGPFLARSIVAYREARELNRFLEAEGTGNYGSDFERSLTTTGRLRSRPGSGFLTVGELANVRRIDAATSGADPNRPWLSDYRMDAGVVFRRMTKINNNPPDPNNPNKDDFPWEPYAVNVVHKSNKPGVPPNRQEDFVEAVARLAALSDWATTRSHVFTVYGVIRGEDAGGEVYEDQAIRFQETVDRLPTAGLESKLPKRIGQRVESAYKDA